MGHFNSLFPLAYWFSFKLYEYCFYFMMHNFLWIEMDPTSLFVVLPLNQQFCQHIKEKLVYRIEMCAIEKH